MLSPRIAHLKTQVHLDTPDIARYLAIQNEVYNAPRASTELLQKAWFLRAFAERIPIPVDPNDLLVGSMRFCGRAGRHPAYCGNVGHVVVDYGMVLREGVSGLRDKILALHTEDSEAFLIALDAFSRYITRCGEAADLLYRQNGADTLRTVRDNCLHLAKHPPQDFWQAVQLVWFIHLFLHAEGMSVAISFGRFDQYLAPYYERGIQSGTYSRAQCCELLQCLWLKVCEGDESQNLIVGGDDAECDFSILCLESMEALRVRQPSISVRIGENPSERFWKAAITLAKAGIGMPSFFNDRVVIASLQNAGIAANDARNYAIVGCYEANPQGCALGLTVAQGLDLHEVLLAYLAQSDEPADAAAFHEGFLAFYRRFYTEQFLPRCQATFDWIRQACPSPFESICLAGCLESGICAEHQGAQYTLFGVNILGFGTLIDSLYTIETLVFKEKAYGYRAFVEQVQQNFPDRKLAARCKALPGKYGTDSPRTNQLAATLSREIAKPFQTERFAEDVRMYPGLFRFLADVHTEHAPATPDGRLQGERLSYGVAASDYATGKTVTSLLRSAAQVAHDLYACGNPILLAFAQKDVEGESGDTLLRAITESFFADGGFNLQYNITDADTLRDAKAHPEAYNDLLVRISGYSAAFVSLHEAVQDALIHRTETQDA